MEYGELCTPYPYPYCILSFYSVYIHHSVPYISRKRRLLRNALCRLALTDWRPQPVRPHDFVLHLNFTIWWSDSAAEAQPHFLYFLTILLWMNRLRPSCPTIFSWFIDLFSSLKTDCTQGPSGFLFLPSAFHSFPFPPFEIWFHFTLNTVFGLGDTSCHGIWPKVTYWR